MDYEEQLSAARYKAERDAARQEVATLKEKLQEDEDAAKWVREHGGLESLEPELKALKFLADGIENDTGIVFFDETEMERCVALRNEVESRLMPAGYEWPRYESGEQLNIGDMTPDARDGSAEVVSIEFFDGAVILRDLEGFPSQKLSVGERVKRPQRNRSEPAQKRALDALLDLAGEMDLKSGEWDVSQDGCPYVHAGYLAAYADRIRELLGAE